MVKITTHKLTVVKNEFGANLVDNANQRAMLVVQVQVAQGRLFTSSQSGRCDPGQYYGESFMPHVSTVAGYNS